MALFKKQKQTKKVINVRLEVTKCVPIPLVVSIIVTEFVKGE